jgi:hypothetical protein
MVEQIAAWKSLGLLALIVGLIALGLWTALRSGAVSVSGADAPPARLAAENLSRTVAALAVWLVVLLVVQELVGFRIPWPNR